MRRLLVSALATFAVAASGLAVTAAPANAEGEPIISAIDVSTPGHAKGTVTTTAPYVSVALRPDGWLLELGVPTIIPTTAGVASFDVETWGLTSGVLRASACATSDPGSCGVSVLSDVFLPLDLVPEITWPEDSTIGTDQEYALNVADAGGGQLTARWSVDWTVTSLDHDGSTALALDDGQGQVAVLRCSTLPYLVEICRDLGISHSVTVNREIWATVSLPQVPISPALGTKLDVGIFVDEPGPVTLDWHLERVSDGSTVLGFGGQIAGYGYGTPKETQLDLTGLGNGLYRFVGTTSKETTEFGTVTGALRQQPEFRVDNTAPVISAMTKTADSVYPYVDGYKDTMGVTVARTAYTDTALMTVVSDSTGETIRTISPHCCGPNLSFVWNGRVWPDTPVPAGTYSLTVSITDPAGNRSEASAGTVTVIRKKTEPHSLRRTVTAASSKIDQHVGRCSTLRKPSLRGWAGSLGYYTNTKCNRTFKNSLVLTVHALRAPQGAVKYGGLRIWAYGGAAKAAPRSLAYLELLDRNEEWLAWQIRLSPTLSSHGGGLTDGADFVFDDRYLIWRAYTAKGAKYDIKNFTVRLKYFILVPE